MIDNYHDAPIALTDATTRSDYYRNGKLAHHLAQQFVLSTVGTTLIV